jgi:hypothetical protein
MVLRHSVRADVRRDRPNVAASRRERLARPEAHSVHAALRARWMAHRQAASPLQALRPARELGEAEPYVPPAAEVPQEQPLGPAVLSEPRPEVAAEGERPAAQREAAGVLPSVQPAAVAERDAPPGERAVQGAQQAVEAERVAPLAAVAEQDARQAAEAPDVLRVEEEVRGARQVAAVRDAQREVRAQPWEARAEPP